MRILVTGVAGFIGFHVALKLLANGDDVFGIDNLNHYYSTNLKLERLSQLQKYENFRFFKLDLSQPEAALATISDYNPDTIIHLAAQAGVRASATAPFDYVSSNLVGHVTILEAARRLPNLVQLVYASSSSVYGNRINGAFSELDRVDEPTSLYAATKRADELMSQVYAKNFNVPTTGLRFFTVYGPYGRPDMAYWSFADSILKGEPVTVYDGGSLKRDFTYIDDIVAGIAAVMDSPAKAGEHRIYNIGNNRPETVLDLVEALESAFGVSAIIRSAERPSYDVETTYANIDAMKADFDWTPTTSLKEGIHSFCTWFKTWTVKNEWAKN